MIAHASPNRMINVSAQIGFRLPAVSSSLGRALLAALDDRQLDKVLAHIHDRKTDAGDDRRPCRARPRIRKTRADGYSLVDGEVEVGFRSVSVPLRRLDGKVIASLNIGAHSNRCTLDKMRHVLLPKLKALAAELQNQMI